MHDTRRNIPNQLPRHEPSGLFGIAVFALLAAVMALALAGCGAAPKIPALEATAGHLARADSLVKAVIPLTQPPVPAILGDARRELGLADKSNEQERVERGALQARYDKLDAKWFVRWGRWIEGILWTLLILWAAAGVLGVALCGFGGPVAVGVGRTVLSFLPMANLFTLAANLIGRRSK